MNKRILFVTTDYSYFTLPVTKALNQLGYQVNLFDYYKPNLLSRLVGISGNLKLVPPKFAQSQVQMVMNRALLNQVKRLEPAYLLVIKGETIYPQTIDQINQLGTITINWFGDGLFFWRWMKRTAPHYRLFINNGYDSYSKLKSIGVKNYYLEYAAPKIYPRPKLAKKYPITFVGQHTSRREAYFKHLADLGLKIWGYHQWQQSSLASIARGPVPVKTAHQIIGHSQIVVNMLTGTTRTQPQEINIRIFETLAHGTFLLTQDYPHLHKYFKAGKELVTFTTPQDLRRKAIYYLSHNREREAIATAGYRRILRDHTFDTRLRQLFKIIA
jgi:spore maturation protein CgeB